MVVPDQALQAAGCFAVVLECVPPLVAACVTRELGIPTIGIGAGPHCSGQVRAAVYPCFACFPDSALLPARVLFRNHRLLPSLARTHAHACMHAN